jgi:hypothetical protein
MIPINWISHMFRTILFIVFMFVSFSASAQTDEEIMTTATTTAVTSMTNTAIQSKPNVILTPQQIQPVSSDVVVYRPATVEALYQRNKIIIYPITVHGVPCVVVGSYNSSSETTQTSISCGWGTTWPKQ